MTKELFFHDYALGYDSVESLYNSVMKLFDDLCTCKLQLPEYMYETAGRNEHTAKIWILIEMIRKAFGNFDTYSDLPTFEQFMNGIKKEDIIVLIRQYELFVDMIAEMLN